MDKEFASLILSGLGVVVTLLLNYWMHKDREAQAMNAAQALADQKRKDDKASEIQATSAESVAQNALADGSATLATAANNIVSVQNDTIQTLRTSINENKKLYEAQLLTQQKQIDILKSDDAQLRVELGRAKLEALEAKRDALEAHNSANFAQDEITRLRQRNLDLETKVADLERQLAGKQEKEVKSD